MIRAREFNSALDIPTMPNGKFQVAGVTGNPLQ